MCRRFQRGLKRKPLALIKKLRKAKKDAGQGEKPEAVRTHLRNMIIVPEMIGSVIGVYNGKTFNQVIFRVFYVCVFGLLGPANVTYLPPQKTRCALRLR
jgi:ribosomal protein uS19